MKNIFSKVIFLMISTVGFANGIPFGTKLILTKINGKPVEQKDIFITIDNEKQSISGNSGCNSFNLSYNKTGTNCIKTKIPITTRMDCQQEIMNSEIGFLNTIKERKFKIKNTENTVVFKNWIGSTIMEFKLETDDKPAQSIWTFIEKNKWKLLSLNDQSKDYKDVFIGFNVSENKIYGNTGCNGFSATYKTKGDNIEFDHVISTLMSCMDEEKNDVERTLLRIFADKNLSFDTTEQTLNFYKDNHLIMIFGIADN